jgi:hypothetical protein
VVLAGLLALVPVPVLILAGVVTALVALVLVLVLVTGLRGVLVAGLVGILITAPRGVLVAGLVGVLVALVLVLALRPAAPDVRSAPTSSSSRQGAAREGILPETRRLKRTWTRGRMAAAGCESER